MFVEFVIQINAFLTLLKTFLKFLTYLVRVRVSLGVLLDGPYQTNPPSPDDIISTIQIDRDGQVRHILHEEEINVQEYQLLTRKILSTLKPLKEIIRENVFCLGVIGTMFPRVFVTCFIVSYTLKTSTLPIRWQNEWSGSLNKIASPHPLNPLLDNILDVPPRPLNPQALQSHPSLDITLFLSPITPLDHIHDTLSPPSPPQPQPPIMGHPLYYNYHDYHGSNCICCFYNRTLFLTLRDEMNIMFAHLEYLLTTTITSHFPPSP
nr:hypothetical protein [Tanacetum cinerariifolium]